MNHKYEATITLLGENDFKKVKVVLYTIIKFKNINEQMEFFNKMYPDNLSIAIKYSRIRKE